jgi:hypothetical protein
MDEATSCHLMDCFWPGVLFSAILVVCDVVALSASG